MRRLWDALHLFRESTPNRDPIVSASRKELQTSPWETYELTINPGIANAEATLVAFAYAAGIWTNKIP